MIHHLQPWKWQRVFGPNVVNSGVALANDNRGNFQIPELNTFATFGVLCTARVAGNVDVKLRFGFALADSITSIRGINFRNLALANESDFNSVAYLNGAGAPNVPGNANSILPPFVTVLVDAPAGVNLTFEIYSSCLFMA